MTAGHCARLLVVGLLAIGSPASGAGQAVDTLAIEHATVLPMDRDTALSDHTILIAGDVIVRLGPSRGVGIPTSARRIDARGRWVIPGLVDMHVHLDREADVAEYLAGGITAVRNMRGRPEHLVWRTEIARGTREGPTIMTSGPTCCRRRFGGNQAFVRIGSPEEAERLARDQAAAGYDAIKLHSSITVPQFERMAVAARTARIPIVGHLVPELGLDRVLAAGQVSIEHADAFDDATPTELAAIARKIAAAKVAVGTIISTRDGRCGPPSAAVGRVIVAFRDAGVRLLASSDAGLDPLPPATSLRCELSSLVAAGLTPWQALATATANAGAFAADHLRHHRTPFGTVAVGWRADLLVLTADPRRDLAALDDRVGMVLRGQWRPAPGTR